MGSAPISRRDTDSRGESSHAYGFQLCDLNDKQAPSLRNFRRHGTSYAPSEELIDNQRRPGVNGSPQNAVPGRIDEVWRLSKGGRAVSC